MDKGNITSNTNGKRRKKLVLKNRGIKMATAIVNTNIKATKEEPTIVELLNLVKKSGINAQRYYSKT